MERKLASIQKVISKIPIAEADRIEQIKVLGWNLIAQKDEFQVEDFCVFFEVDALLPDYDARFKFMEKRQYRVKTIKMKGVLSQGLALPLSEFPEITSPEEGLDVSELLEVKKWEMPEIGSFGGSQRPRGNFPFWVRKTDEVRVQSEPKLLDELRGLPYYITEKLDGTSMTVAYREGDIHVCSRNVSLRETEDSTYWKVARTYQILEKLLALKQNIAIQGELCGPRIQGNRLQLHEPDLFVFNIYNIDSQEYLSYNDVVHFCVQMEIKLVPLLRREKEFRLTLEELITMAEGKYNSTENDREGIVIRPLWETYSETLKGRLSFKVLNNQYLLKEK